MDRPSQSLVSHSPPALASVFCPPPAPPKVEAGEADGRCFTAEALRALSDLTLLLRSRSFERGYIPYRHHPLTFSSRTSTHFRAALSVVLPRLALLSLSLLPPTPPSKPQACIPSAPHSFFPLTAADPIPYNCPGVPIHCPSPHPNPAFTFPPHPQSHLLRTTRLPTTIPFTTTTTRTTPTARNLTRADAVDPRPHRHGLQGRQGERLRDFLPVRCMRTHHALSRPQSVFFFWFVLCAYRFPSTHTHILLSRKMGSRTSSWIEDC